jgi:hypothetical protein
MNDRQSLLTWWQQERAKELDRLSEKSLSEPLTEVEKMIMNPLSSHQARNQINMLNASTVDDTSCSGRVKL